MNVVLDAGIEFILFLQSLGGWLTEPMKFFSFMGNEEFFLMVMPALLWSLDARLGLRVGLLLMVSNNLNGVLKMLLQGPRPYFYDVRVQALSSEISFGIPSGHAQNSAAVWGLIAAQLRRPLVWVAMLALIFLIGLSRMYLGVHFPSDVILGWAAGLMLVWGFMRLEPVILRRMALQGLPQQIATVFGVALVMLLIPVLVRLSLGAWTLPAAWVDTLNQTFPGGELPEPLALSGHFTGAGAFFGLAAGALMLRRQGGFTAQGAWWKRLARYPLGLAGVLVLYFGLGAIFPRGEELLPYILRFIRYTLIGLWVTWWAPALFIRLGLAQPDAGAASGEAVRQPAS